MDDRPLNPEPKYPVFAVWRWPAIQLALLGIILALLSAGTWMGLYFERERKLTNLRMEMLRDAERAARIAIEQERAARQSE